MTLMEHLQARSKTFLVALGLLLLAIVAGIDYVTSTRYVLEFSPFYVVPVAFFTWFVGNRAAAGLGLVCAGVGVAARLQSIPRLSAF
jgi:hypothetical protein